MSAARQINPSYKPLPALPIGNSGKSDLQLDSISIGHIRKILQQSLYNCSVNPDPWESIILGIIFDISDTVPKAIEVLYQYEMIKNEIISSQKKNNEKIDDKNDKKKDKKDEKDKKDDKDKKDEKDDKDKKDNKDDDIIVVDNQEKLKNVPKFVIKLKKEEGGRVSDSHFVYNYFDGEDLFKHEDNEGSELINDEMKHWIGGTIILKGSKKHTNRVDKILELMVYVVCNLRLEVCLFRDYSVLRVVSKDNHDAEDVQNALRNSRRTSKSSWLGWLMKHKNVSSIKEQMMKSLNEKNEKNEKHEKHEKHEKYNKNEKHDKHDKPDKPDKPNLLMRRISTKRSSISKTSTISSTSINTTNTDDDDDVINLNTNKFGSSIRQMEKTILSISPGVKFPPPHLLLRLREEEKEIRLHTNLDGTFKSYMAREALDLANEFSNGNVNSTGKYRTYAAISRSNQLSLDFRSGLAYLMTNDNSLNGIFKHQSLSCSYSRFWSPTSISPCHNHRIITLEYYNKYNDHVDKSLGEMINWLCDQAHEVCQDSSCDHPGIDHITTYTHNTGRININLEEVSDSKSNSSSNVILMWTECKICSAKTQMIQMSHATYFYSFGKYLELLFYNEEFRYKNLCQHSESRESVVRYFRKDNLIAKVEYEHVDLFEIRLPKLQISQEEAQISDNLGEAENIDKLFTIDAEDSDRLLNETRLEVTYFYGVVKQHITALEEYFDSLIAHRKETSTSGWVDLKVDGNEIDSEVKQDYNYLEMLDEMLIDFRKEEFELYDILKKSKATILNDVRKLLVTRIHSTKKRLLDWQKKHVREEDLEKFSNIDLGVPEYASSNICHVFPGSPIIVREDEPTSIIALALSSRDYLKELSIMRQNVRLSITQSAPVTPTSEPQQQPQISNSFSSLISSLTSPTLQDTINSGGDYMDQYSLSIRRKLVKESPGNGISDKISHGIESLGGMNPFNLSLSGKDKKKVPEKDGEKLTSTKSAGKFGAIFGQKNENPEKPKDENTENEKQEVFNEKVPLDKEDKKPQTIVDPEKAAIEKDQKQSLNEKVQKQSSKNEKVQKQSFNEKDQKQSFNEKDQKQSSNEKDQKQSSGEKDHQKQSSNEKELPKKKDETIIPSPATFVKEFTWNRKIPKDSPHLKYQGTHGNKKFSCTIYHASEFDSLRRRCGIENICIESLSRCDSWKVTGGKSASTFFKTKDERLVVKQMVSSWRTGEKEALLKFAPKYFDYMNKPPSKPSVLAKIFGFYTIKIKDTKKNNVILKMDVLVMEHLFFEKTITRKFDLKGIQERHTKDQTQDNATLWDGDWVEGRYKSLLLIHSHSKKLIREAILNDTQFLSDSNIMDYSLLVGVDDEKKELVVGIVDFIGTYTWYKKIENRGKTIGRNPKEVTVLPPDQYKDRFRNSIDQYFSAVPDKWIKSPTTDDNPLSPEPQTPTSPTSLLQPIKSKLPSVL